MIWTQIVFLFFQNRLDLKANSATDELYYDHCPICAVTCRCSKCGRRREALGIQLKRLCQMQGAEPSSAVFEGMFSCFTNPQAAIRMAKQARKRDAAETASLNKPRESLSLNQKKAKPPAAAKIGRKPSKKHHEVESHPQLTVGKPPPSDFPREFRGGVDVDPGTFLDYRTVFTAEGQIVKDLQSMPKQSAMPKQSTRKSSDAPPVVEDGNVDYCHTCRQAGDLLCCDYCPRAFHESCLDAKATAPSDDSSRWECHLCKLAKEDLPEYMLSGQQSLSKICAAYSEVPASGDDLTQLSILSKIHEMLEKLMKSDYGVHFAEPVTGIEGYSKIVKTPMDLGTIGSKLLNGEYKKFFDAHKSWSDVHLAILKDVELVWNNCFLFNLNGSAIARMADVLRKRMLAMRAKSIDRDLAGVVLSKLDEYAKTCRKKRGTIAVPPHLDGRPTSRHRITIKSTKIGRSTKVAILDPETGMVVKIYTTLRSAAVAADYVGKSHKHELRRAISEDAVKDVVKRSADDPSVTLFGHRWLELEKLQAGHVRFGSAAPKIQVSSPVFEVMIDGKSNYRFFSVDEAVTFPRLEKTTPREELRKALAKLTVGGEFETLFGLKWRRRKSVADGKALHTEVILSPFWANLNKQTGPNEEMSIDNPATITTKTMITKEDRIIGRTVGGFESHDSAFEDWEYACECSPSVPVEEITRSTFHTYYLDGDRNVDGVIWKTVETTLPSDGEEVSEPARKRGTEDEAMSQGPSFVSNEEEMAVPNEKGVSTDRVAETEGIVANADSSLENLPEATGENQFVNGSDAKSADPIANGLKKRKRAEEDILTPSKK